MSSLDQFTEQLLTSTLLGAEEAETARRESQATDGEQFAQWLVRQSRITPYQAERLLAGDGQSLVMGNYVILDQLGRGGMGTVVKARHQRMKRLVALKFLSPGALRTAELSQRFEREVEAAARLSHPNVVQAFDSDEVRGVHFLVMEYVDGRDLASLVKSRGPLPVAAALQCLLQAARGLEYAHEQGVIHRDIKPANLLLTPDGRVKILDMGLARLTGDEEGGTELTATGDIMGTIDYMAPEQAENTHTVGPPADIYSLGCTLHFLLTGRPAYDAGSTIKRLIAHRESPIPSLRSLRPEIPPEIDRLFARMVSKQPEDRFASMADVISAIEQSEFVQDTHRGAGRNSGAADPLKSWLLSPAKTVPTEVTAGLVAPARTKMLEPAAAVDQPTVIAGESNTASGQISGEATADNGWQQRAELSRAGVWPRGIWAAGIAAVLLLGGIVMRMTTGDRIPREVVHQPPGERADSGEPVPPSTESIVPEGDVERAAAAWVHSVGGRFSARVAGETVGRWFNPGQPLPDQPFSISAILINRAQIVSADLERFVGLRQLVQVKVEHAGVDAEALSIFARIPSLRSLGLTYTAVKSSDLVRLEPLSRLSHLSLGSDQNDDDWQSLARLRGLHEIQLYNATPKDVEQLARHPRLRVISLPGLTELEEAAVQAAQRINPSLRLIVDAEGGKGTTRTLGHDPVRALAQRLQERGVTIRLVSFPSGASRPIEPYENTGLNPFYIRDITIPPTITLDDVDLQMISTGDAVNLSARGCSRADELAQAIVKMSSLGYLTLDGSTLTDPGLEQFVQLPLLTKLDIKKTRVTEAGVRKFCEARPDVHVVSDFGEFLPKSGEATLATETEPD